MYQEEIPFGAAGAIFLRSQAKESRKTDLETDGYSDVRLLYIAAKQSLLSLSKVPTTALVVNVVM
jgi:hypothetical protein